MGKLQDSLSKENLRKATVDDLRKLPENTLYELDLNIMQDDDARGVVMGAQTQESQRSEQERLCLPPAPKRGSPFDFLDEKNTNAKPDPFVQVVEEAGWDDFGYILYRIDYSDDERWNKWSEEFVNSLDQSIEGASGADRVAEKLLFPMFDDPEVDLTNFANVQRCYNDIIKHSDTMQPGLNVGVCLAADKDAINSLLDPEPGVPPWVWVIDDSYDFSKLDSITNDEYPGHFPVAISSLVPDLYPFLASPGRNNTGFTLLPTSAMTPERLWSKCKFDKENPVWTSAFDL